MRPTVPPPQWLSQRPHRARLQRMALGALVALALVAGSCKPGAPGSKAGGGKGIDVSMTIAAADVKGQRVASVTIQTGTAIQGAQLTFEPPTGCQVVAGSLVRTIASLQPGTPVSQQIALQCDSAAKGELKATVEGLDEKGTALHGAGSAGL